MRLLLWAAVLALGACAAVVPSSVPSGPSFRDHSVPIGVTSRFNTKDFEGLWYVRAGFDPDIGRMALRMMETPAGRVMRLGVVVCDAAGGCGDFAEDLPVKTLGKGRFLVTMPDGQDREMWVLWLDEGFRTAVLGNKVGDFGWIIDRSTTGGADRIKAAREILDFNGYAVNMLRTVK